MFDITRLKYISDILYIFVVNIRLQNSKVFETKILAFVPSTQTKET